MYYIAQLLGIIAWFILIISYWKSGSKKLLYLQITACIFFALNYTILGAFSGLLVVIFEIIRDYLYLKVKEPKKIFYISIIVYLIIAIVTYNGSVLSLFCIFASLCDGYALTNKGNKVVLYSIITYSLWIIYDLSYGSYGTVVAESFIIISNTLFLLNCYSIYLKSDNLRIEKGFSITNNMLKIFNKLDKNNYDDEYIWSISKEGEIIKNNKTDYIFIYDDDELIGYINFIRIPFDKFDEITKNKEYIDIDIKDIKRFSKKVGNYININSICIKNSYKNDRTIKLVSDVIKKYLLKKEKYGYKINGLLCVSASKFEEDILNYSKFRLEKTLEEDNNIYTMEGSRLNKYLKE